MIARPARVRIRSRKPWVLDRRRLFGWNVRLLTRYSHYNDVGGRAPGHEHARGADGDGRSRTPVAPGSCSEPGRTAACTAGPAADSAQHSRGTTTPGGRPDPTGQAPPQGPRTAGPTRRDVPPGRCRAVDRAVSVAVVPRRTTGFRRGGDPAGHPVGTSSARPLPSALTSEDVPHDAGRRSTGRRGWPGVHSLWTPVWNRCVQASTGAIVGSAGRCRVVTRQRVGSGEHDRGAPGAPGADGKGRTTA